MAGQIVFSYIPGSGLTAPGRFVEFNSGGQYQAQTRVVLIGKKTSAGTLGYYTASPVASQAQAEALAGPGSHLAEMYRIAAQNDPSGSYWIVPLNDSSLTADVRTITIGGTPNVGVGKFEISGERLQIVTSSTDTTTTIAAAVRDAVNNYWNPLTNARLPVTATASGAVVTVTARNKGASGTTIDIYTDKTDTTNIFSEASVWTVATTTAGTGTPTDVATALAALADDPADFVVCPYADATSLAAYTAWASDISGRWAWNRQSYGHVWTAYLGNFAAQTTLGLSLDDRHTTVIGCISGSTNGTPHPPWLWAAGMMARVRAWLADVTTGNVSRAHAGLVVQGLRPPRDRSVWPNYSARNTLLNSGISTWGVTAVGEVTIDKLITTYRTNPVSGQTDTVFRDVQRLYQLSGGFGYIRAGLGVQFGQKAIAPSNPGNLGAIVTPADIKGAEIQLYGDMCDRGVFSSAAKFAQSVVVKINADNPGRVDSFYPVEAVNPLDILALNATVYQQFPAVPSAA